MEQIIFFTQPSKLLAINLKLKNFDEFEILKSTTHGSTNRILIFNEIGNASIDGLIKDYTTYFVYHNGSLEDEKIKKILNNANYKLKDHHRLHSTKVYHKIGEIRNGYDDKIFEEIKKRIIDVKLETALDFLHECLLGKPKKGIPFEIEKTFKGKNNLVTLKQVFDEWNGPNDLNGLRRLRDIVLEWAEV